MLMAIELMFNAANLALIAFARLWVKNAGHIFAFLVITVAAAEAAIGLAIVVTSSAPRSTSTSTKWERCTAEADASRAGGRRVVPDAGRLVAAAACGRDPVLGVRAAAARPRRDGWSARSLGLVRSGRAFLARRNAGRGRRRRRASGVVLVDAGLRLRALARSALADVDVHHHRRRLPDPSSTRSATWTATAPSRASSPT